MTTHDSAVNSYDQKSEKALRPKAVVRFFSIFLFLSISGLLALPATALAALFAWM